MVVAAGAAHVAGTGDGDAGIAEAAERYALARVGAPVERRDD